MKQKRAIFLLELVVALGLTSILVAVLLRFCVACASMDQRIGAAEKRLLALEHAYMRLSRIFLSIPSQEASFHSDKDDPARLSFRVDCGVDPDPSLSGLLEGALFVDPQNRLTLALRPPGGQAAKREEYLLADVSDLAFEYLSPDGWKTEWPDGADKLPPCLRMTLSRRQAAHPLEFAFPLAVFDIIDYTRPK